METPAPQKKHVTCTIMHHGLQSLLLSGETIDRYEPLDSHQQSVFSADKVTDGGQGLAIQHLEENAALGP